MKRKIGSSDVAISPITFGAWAIGGWMWGGAEEQESIGAIRASIDAGITSIDTAPMYGFGLSEEIIGKAIKDYDRSKIEILTKFGMRWDTDKGTLKMKDVDREGKEVEIKLYSGYDSIINEVEKSLQRLQTDYIDLIQMHWPDATTPIEESMRAMEKLLQEGKVRAIGVCNYSGEQMEEAERTVRLHANQIPYSMLKQDVERDVIPYAVVNNVGVIAYSPLERGLLTGKYNMDSVFADTDHRSGYFKQYNMDKVNTLLRRLSEFAEKYSCTTAQLVLAWTIHQPGITAALAGARNARQAMENAKALQVNINDADLQQINYWLNNEDFKAM